MDIRQNPLLFSFPLPGRWFQTRVRVSFWFLLLGLVLCFRLGLELGLWVTVLLFFSILFHEFAHVLTARRTGGDGDEILMWPLGGLAFVNPAPTFYSEFWTVAAGPLSNLLLCLVTLPAVLSAGLLGESLHLIYLPPVSLSPSAALAQDLLVLLFALNFKLLVLNLLPIYPLDGGQMAFCVAKLHWDRETAKIGSLWAGLLLCILISVAGLMLQSTEVLFVAFMLTFFCMFEYITARVSPHFDDSFMGYDFSQGYTSLERLEEEERQAKPGTLERWKLERERKRKEREEQQRRETERRVDELLDKVHREGMDSLTEAERRFLKRASTRYKSREE
jgi:stage IV sporulation protein FB